MNWSNVIIIAIAGLVAGIFTPIVSRYVIRFLEKVGLIKNKQKK